MTPQFRLYGAELSPYSVKVRAYLRCKKLPFEWLERSNARQEEFARYAKLPLAPLLVDAEETPLQDSTPIIETLERQFAEPSIMPEEPALGFLAALIEDYADEWLNKAMFHYRWTYPADQESASRRIVQMLFEGAEAPEGIADSVRARMTARLHHVGSSPDTAPIIEASFARALAALERVFEGGRSYLFGGRPSLADFGLAGQLTQLLSDPTPGAMIKAQAPNLLRWIDRMENPDADGAFVSFASLRDALSELLRVEIAGAYLPWMAANARAVAEEAPALNVEIDGAVFSQRPQRYAAKAFAELRRKRALVEDEALAALLQETGCDAFLLSVGGAKSEADEGEAGDDDAEAVDEGEE